MSLLQEHKKNVYDEYGLLETPRKCSSFVLSEPRNVMTGTIMPVMSQENGR